MARTWARRRIATFALLAALGWSLAASLLPASVGAEDESAACTPYVPADGASVDGLVPFESLAQGNVYDHGPPRSILLVSAKPDPIVSVIDPASAPTIAGVDLSTNGLVALFIGRWPQEGHLVTIQSVRVTDAGVCLTALVIGPQPGQDAADAETYPYHVVSLPLAGLPQAPGTAWTVVGADGAPIATTTFP